MALSSNCAVAAIMVGGPFQAPAEELLSSLALEAKADLTDGEGMACPTDPQTDPPKEPGNPRSVRYAEALGPGGAAASRPSSISQGSGGGFGNPAITGIPRDLAQPALQTTLPTEARPYLPTGPPFELLRPPRFCVTLVVWCLRL